MPKISVIMPCYNHGNYIREAIQSVEVVENNDLYEIIIIDDGSTDEYTKQQLNELVAEGYHVIFQENMGPCAARNNGIKAAKGEYLLPLDSDNKIRPEYMRKGLEILENNPDIAIVYGDGQIFGEEQGIFKQGPFNLQRLMIANYIDSCAVYRKKVWEVTKGYDINTPAVEDWEIWLHAAFKGFKFHYIDEILFDYRILKNSFVRQLKANKLKGIKITEYMIEKHKDYFGPQYIDADIMSKFSTSPLGFISKLILKKYFPKKFNDLVSKGKLRRYI